ncbi:MAG: hypothetical protein AAB692_02530 [Patescibacteria group bacterium]
MTLAEYYENYAKKPNEEILRRASVKEEELRRVFKEFPFKTNASEVRVAVLGCGDKRFVPHHRRIFEKLTGKPVDLTTFDLDIEHLTGKLGTVQHDVTTPLPGEPFDITYGHVFLKFIETEKQWDVIQNSYDALTSPGLAIHVFDIDELAAKTEKLADGLFSVPLDRWQKKLRDAGVEFKFIPWIIEKIITEPVEGAALVLKK